MSRVCHMLVFLALAVPNAASLAQVVKGDSIRLRAEGREMAQGRFLRADSAALFLVHVPAGDTLRVPSGTFNRVERLDRGSPIRRAVIGGLIGTGFGFLLGPGGRLPNLVRAVGLGAAGAVATEMRGAGRAEWRYVPLGDPGTERSATTPLAGGLVLATSDTVTVFYQSDELAHGILTAFDSAMMRVESLDGAVSTTIPRSRIVRIDVLRGRPRRGIGAVAGGMIAGGAVGVVASRVMQSGVRNHEDDGLATLVIGTAGALAGTIGGVFVAFTRRERWIRVDPITLALLETS